MSTSEQRHDSQFVPFAKQEGDHKVHIVVLPQFDWSQLPRVESKYLKNCGQKIIAGRPYQTLEELVAKKAVGQSVFEKIKNQLAL